MAAKPTRRWLRQRAKVWVPRLGLERWDVELLDEPCDDANALTWRSNSYDRATIQFSDELAEWSFGRAEQTLVHELLHLCHRDVDQAFSELEDRLQGDVWSVARGRYDHVMEGFIDRLASRLVEIGSK